MLFFNLIFNCVLSVIIVLLKFSECDILNFCSDEAQLFQIFIMPTHNRFGSISRRHNLTRFCTIRCLLSINRGLIFLTRTKHFLLNNFVQDSKRVRVDSLAESMSISPTNVAPMVVVVNANAIQVVFIFFKLYW